MQGLNLKECKKIEEDEKSATFHHPKGHQIKIAKSVLTPRMRENLESLPLHKAHGGDVFKEHKKHSEKASDKEHDKTIKENHGIDRENHQNFMKNHEEMMRKTEPKMMADGGDIQDHLPEESNAPDPSHGVNININASPQPQGAPQPVVQPAVPPVQQAVPEAPAPQPQASFPQTPEDAPPTPNVIPDNVAQSLNAPSPEQFRQQQFQKDVNDNKTDYIKEDLAFQHDLANGHITPKTYKDLFAEKSTLGKISTIFGLLVGGAGSGLAHQPDALMSMMDQQIKNDLDAQIKSRDNAQNFWKINQADLANKAGAIQNLAAANASVYATSQAQMRQATVHSLLQYANTLPAAQQGPYRQALIAMSKKIMEDNNNAFDVAAAAKASQGINPFNKAQGAGSARNAGKPAVGPNAKSKDQPEDEHFLSSGANDAAINAINSNPRFMGLKDAILQQKGDVALADKAIDAINESIPKLRTLSEDSGYARRQSHKLAGVPVIGPFIEGVSHLASDTDTNRSYDSLYSRVEGAVRGALKGQVGAEELDRLVHKNAPEAGESYDTFLTKLNTLKSYIKDHTKTDLLENIPGVTNKRKKK